MFCFGILIVLNLIVLRAATHVAHVTPTRTRSTVLPDDMVRAALSSRWEIWPYGSGLIEAGDSSSERRVGLLTGGSSDLFGGGNGSYGDATVCLMRFYALQRGYAFYAERAMQRLGQLGDLVDRPVAWQKIRLLAERLDDVDLIVWVDADIAWTRADVDLTDLFFRRLSTLAACNGHLGQAKWDAVGGTAAIEEEPSKDDSWLLSDRFQARSESDALLFLWASADVRPRQKQNMNLNTGLIALRAGPASKRFLQEVWSEGDDLLSFTRHNPGWRNQPPGSHYFGWPFEQGAIWSVLYRNQDFLSRTCIVELGVLHSVQYHRWHAGGPLGAHMPGMSNQERRQAACHHLGLATRDGEAGRCGQMLRTCPDLFAGRLLAPHAEGVCAHCLGAAFVDPKELAKSIRNVSDFSHFDCSCLRQMAS